MNVFPIIICSGWEKRGIFHKRRKCPLLFFGTALDVLADIFHFAIQYFAKAVKGDGFYHHVFSQAVQLCLIDMVVFYKGILWNAFFLHSFPQTVIYNHSLSCPIVIWLLFHEILKYNIVRVRTIFGQKNKGICFSVKTDTFTLRAYLLHIGRYPLHCSLGFCIGGQGWMSLWHCFFWNGLAVLRLCHNHGLGNIVWLLCFSWFPTICHILSFFAPFYWFIFIIALKYVKQHCSCKNNIKVSFNS